MPTMSREEGFDLAWSAPMRDLAKRFGLSDVGLKKAFARFEIPTPPQGYWSKVLAGKHVERPALPPRGPGMPWQIELASPGASGRAFYDPILALQEPEPQEPTFPEPMSSVAARVSAALGKIRAIKALDRPHPLVRKLLTKDEERRGKQERDRWMSSFYSPYFDSAFEQRRLKVLNSILIALGRFLRSAESRGPTARELWLTIGMQPLQLWLDHPDAKPNRHGEWETRSGKVDQLRLVLGHNWSSNDSVRWQDEPTAPLESQLKAIVVGIAAYGETLLREHSVSHYQWQMKRREDARAKLVERERKAREAELQRREAEIAEVRRQLLAYASDHRAAEDVRALVLAAELRASQDAISDGSFATWKAWALGVAADLDPLGKLPEILKATG